jgi:5-methylcytosine-specific restriction endonuclease McrA
MAKKTLPDSAAVEKKRAAGREYSRTHRAQSNAWKAANRDKINAAEREARKKDPEIFRASVARYMASEKGKAVRRAYYLANVEDFIRRAKKAAEANPDRALANKRAYYEANKAEIKQRVREWNAANPEATRARGRNYRARSRGAEGSHTAEDIKALFEKQKGKCIYCSIKLGDSYHADHITPLARGGSNWPSNLQLTCERCNNRKRAIDPIEFARRNGRLI